MEDRERHLDSPAEIYYVPDDSLCWCLILVHVENDGRRFWAGIVRVNRDESDDDAHDEDYCRRRGRSKRLKQIIDHLIIERAIAESICRWMIFQKESGRIW